MVVLILEEEGVEGTVERDESGWKEVVRLRADGQGNMSGRPTRNERGADKNTSERDEGMRKRPAMSRQGSERRGDEATINERTRGESTRGRGDKEIRGRGTMEARTRRRGDEDKVTKGQAYGR